MMSRAVGANSFIVAALPLMIVTGIPRLLAVVYSWPCTFGVYIIARFSFLICSIQCFDAGLLHGEIVVAGRTEALYNAFALAGMVMLHACYLATLARSCPSPR